MKIEDWWYRIWIEYCILNIVYLPARHRTRFNQICEIQALVLRRGGRVEIAPARHRLRLQARRAGRSINSYLPAIGFAFRRGGRVKLTEFLQYSIFNLQSSII
ncbi:MAG: hypothetical protein KKH17_12770 [Proteobacteria bacterium]|nr:hypothetical protein [Pseudomonadota bacterium]